MAPHVDKLRHTVMIKHHTEAEYGNWAMVGAFILCFAGSALYLAPPMRPFLWGAALVCLTVVFSPAWRKVALQCRLLVPILLALALTAAQWLWADHMGRYYAYAVMMAVGCAHALLGEMLARKMPQALDWLLPLAAMWFIVAFFPAYDVLTGSSRFRPGYIMTGGVWDNINDMATVLLFACLIWFLAKGRLSLWLLGGAWLYIVALNRRADLAAIILFTGCYLIWLYPRPKRAHRLQVIGVITAAIAVALLLHRGAFYLGSLPLMGSSAPVQEAPVERVSPANMGLPSIPAVWHDTANFDAYKHATTAAKPPEGVVAEGGDFSSAIRVSLLLEMAEVARQLPWWQFLVGMGAGQLNLTWPLTGSPWASPHFFWLEMLFYVGIAWAAFLLWLFWRLNWRGRIALLCCGLAGMAPSSMVYFQPFWFFAGILAASIPPRRQSVVPAAEASALQQTH
ncbi:hypothetical protein [Bordetella bronchiseptica]|uniref:hypothetical protein n=1 Tax=Bordetella bronchiseptica TaxID=518 RepID=UPI0012689111|nr:hypothetical protein [Bordetella bronchiseptica]